MDRARRNPESTGDEVHRLLEMRRWRFALCGSSARTLRRGGVNLLGGRALTRFMGPFSQRELGSDFDADFSLQWGLLPLVQADRRYAADLLQAYVHTYIKEEISEEGLVRRLPPFLRFLEVAGLLNGQVVNGLNIARDAAIPRSSVDGYFSILQDTLLELLRYPPTDLSSKCEKRLVLNSTGSMLGWPGPPPASPMIRLTACGWAWP